MYNRHAISTARSSKEKVLALLLTADLGEMGSIQSLSPTSHSGQLLPVLGSQYSQIALGNRGSDFWQLKENHPKRCWFHLNIEQNKHFPSSWIEVQCLTPAHQHRSVLGCWGSRCFRGTRSSTSHYSFEFWSWQAALTESHHSMVIQLLAQNDTVILFWFLVHRSCSCYQSPQGSMLFGKEYWFVFL